MNPLSRLLLAIFLAHLAGSVSATTLLAFRRRVVYDIPLHGSLTPVRFLPHLAVGPVLAAHSLYTLIDRPRELPDKRLAESFGYFLPLGATAWLAYRLLPRPGPLVGVCPRCGYDLRGTPDLCPECGFVPPRVDPPAP